MPPTTSKYILPDGRRVKNSISSQSWPMVFGCSFITWGLSVATIGVAANAFVKWKDLRNRVNAEASQNNVNITLSSPELEPAGIAIIVLSSLLCIFTMMVMAHLFTHRPGTKKIARRGFFGVPTFYYAMGPVFIVLSWLVFAVIVAYTRFYNTAGGALTGVLPNGQGNFKLSLTDFRYKNFNFLTNVVYVSWFLWLLGFVTAMVLIFSADETIELPFVLDNDTPSRLENQIGGGAPGTRVAIDRVRETSPTHPESGAPFPSSGSHGGAEEPESPRFKESLHAAPAAPVAGAEGPESPKSTEPIRAAPAAPSGDLAEKGDLPIHDGGSTEKAATETANSPSLDASVPVDR